MLKTLHIHKYALIDNCNIDFYPGFSVITGETGAGKSILLGAIGLLLGERADTKVISTGAGKCVVEAVFQANGTDIRNFFDSNSLDFYNNECILRREISANGKSRAFINDSPATLAQMKELGRKLIDIHSQHQNLLLGGSDFQMNVLDCVAGNHVLIKQYKKFFSKYSACVSDLAELKEQIDSKRTEEDYLRYQLETFDQACLKDGEQEELEQEQQKLSHVEDINETLCSVYNEIDSEEDNTIDKIMRCSDDLSHIERYFPNAGQLSDRLNSVGLELRDIIDELKTATTYDYDTSSKLRQIDERLTVIYDLERRHHLNSVAELLAKAEDMRKQISLIDDADELLAHKEAECKSLKLQVEQIARELSITRKKAAELIIMEMKRRLVTLGMPDMKFDVEVTQTTELTKNGWDKIRFLFSANKNIPTRDISDIASGGEIARVMLCLKAIISNVSDYPTVIFDEIDTGVSGRIAEQMARIMQEMSSDGKQVISITHLPQIAACGENHYRVYKQTDDVATNSMIELLSSEQRIQEIAYMLSGKNITTAALDNARELLGKR